jgi:hypothetical protein
MALLSSLLPHSDFSYTVLVDFSFAKTLKNLNSNQGYIIHLELREGKITIPGTRRSNERTMKLDSHQVFDLYDYLNDIRRQILALTKKQTKQLFISTGTGNNYRTHYKNSPKRSQQKIRL